MVEFCLLPFFQAAAEAGEGDTIDDPALLPQDDEEDEESVEAEIPSILEEFSEEDWMLAQLRCEILSLIQSFSRDVNDPERISFPALHFPYYYQLYSGKTLHQTLFQFSCKTADELLRLVPEICAHTQKEDEFAPQKSLLSDYDLVLPSSEFENATVSSLIEVTEDARQMRTDRLDAGDENAALTFVYRPPQPRRQQQDAAALKQQVLNRQSRKNSPAAQYDQFNAAKRQRGNNIRR